MQLASKMEKSIVTRCARMFEDQGFIQSLKERDFDFGMFESVDYCGYGLFKLIGVHQYALTTAMALPDEIALALGLPGRAAPLPLNHDYHPGMTFPERVINYFSPIIFNFWNQGDDAFGASLVKQYADPEFTKFEVIANSRYIFVNADEHIDFPRPTSPKIIHIGGITIDVAATHTENLSPEYRDIFDSVPDGVVLISFGSLAKSSEMPMESKTAFIKTFAKFPRINFIWKFENENDTAGDDLPNVFKRKWVPQKEILGKYSPVFVKNHWKFLLQRIRSFSPSSHTAE